MFVLVVAQSSSEIPERLMNNPVLHVKLFLCETAGKSSFIDIFCCILRGPGGERIVDVVPGGTELETQVKTGSWACCILSQ